MRDPDVIYKVVVTVGDGTPARSSEKMGGTFTDRYHADQRIKRNLARGRTVRLFVTECNWKEIK